MAGITADCVVYRGPGHNGRIWPRIIMDRPWDGGGKRGRKGRKTEEGRTGRGGGETGGREGRQRRKGG